MPTAHKVRRLPEGSPSELGETADKCAQSPKQVSPAMHRWHGPSQAHTHDDPARTGHRGLAAPRAHGGRLDPGTSGTSHRHLPVAPLEVRNDEGVPPEARRPGQSLRGAPGPPSRSNPDARSGSGSATGGMRSSLHTSSDGCLPVGSVIRKSRSDKAADVAGWTFFSTTLDDGSCWRSRSRPRSTTSARP